MELINASSWPAMAAIASLLGMRHGLDLDHLSTIDAIVRTQKDRPHLARWVGTLFSFGHGIIVTIGSLILGGGLLSTHIPQWIEGLGQMISIFFLTLFGGLTLWSVLFSEQSRQVPYGIKSFLAQKLAKKKIRPLFIIGIGALFALSFDTLSQVALFAMTGSLGSGLMISGILGICFTLGMMIADGLNGLIIANLIQKAGKMSLIISKALGLAIAMFSLYLACKAVIDFSFEK